MRELDTEKLVGFHQRAEEVRRIAETIFDDAERAAVLQFVDDSGAVAAFTLQMILQQPSQKS